MSKPKRPYELEIKIGAGDLKTILEELKNIEFDLYRRIQEKDTNKINIISGSPSCGYTIIGLKTETKNNKEYFQQIDKFLNQGVKKL